MICNGEASSVEEVVRKEAGKVAVVGIAWFGSNADMQGFVDRYHLTFATAVDGDGTLYAFFGVPAQPAWIFVDRAGLPHTHLGPLEPGELTAELDKLAA